MAAVSGLICTIKHVKILGRFNFVGFSEESVKWYETLPISRSLIFQNKEICEVNNHNAQLGPAEVQKI